MVVASLKFQYVHGMPINVNNYIFSYWTINFFRLTARCKGVNAGNGGSDFPVELDDAARLPCGQASNKASKAGWFPPATA